MGGALRAVRLSQRLFGSSRGGCRAAGYFSAAPGCHSAYRSYFGYRLLRRPPGAGLPRQCGAAGLACPCRSGNRRKAGGFQLGSGLCRCRAVRSTAGNHSAAACQCVWAGQAGNGAAGAGALSERCIAARHMDVRPAGLPAAHPGQPAAEPFACGTAGRISPLFCPGFPGHHLCPSGGGAAGACPDPARRGL